MAIVSVVLLMGCATVPEADPDTRLDTSFDTSWDTTWDTGTDPGWDSDVPTDTTVDSLPDTAPDTATDTALDTATDTAPDTATDTAPDTVTDPDVETDAPAVCGDGTVSGSEQCDDGNVAPLDGCASDCTWEYCGDGAVGDLLWSLEGFESGGLTDPPWTSSGSYTFAPDSTQAHDGTASLGSTNGGSSSTTATITLSEHTDGTICFWFAGQSESCCDDFRFQVDGTTVQEWAGDHRTWTEFCHDAAAGTHEFTWIYAKDSSVDTGWDAFFLDDVRLSNTWSETCDDGNNTGGDGCSRFCITEECGNAILDVGEVCDDGNLTSGDGCSPACELEYCGDGVTGDLLTESHGFETGVPGFWSWTEGASYTFEPGTTQVHDGTTSLESNNAGSSSTTATITLSEHMDGTICFWFAGQSESCCDDFRFQVDGTTVQEWAGDHRTWTEFCHDAAAGTHDFTWVYAKDSSVDTGWDAFFLDDITLYRAVTEQCDDGNTSSGDGCSDRCTVEECGNDILDVGEECDDGNLVDGDGCHPDCTLPLCGDGDVGWSRPFEGFETADLSQLPWSTGTGSSAWVVVTSPSNAHTGRNLAASDSVGISSSLAWLEVTLTFMEDGDVCFFYRGESESCCDDFLFRIDGTVMLTDAGSVTTWTEHCSPVTAGTHTMRWEYDKDSSISTGADRFSVDDITFPMVQEQCDDSGTDPGDGCDSNCRTE